MTAIDRPTIENWLRTLLLGQYAESFLDNGYDDLEICKQIGEQDLDAIGVFNPTHRFKMLEAVRKLREEGATAVYFTVEEVLRSSAQTCQCGSAGSVPSASPSSGRRSPCQYCIGGGGSGSVASRERPESRVASPTAAAAENGSGLSQQPPELKRLASPKLRQTLQNKLVIDGIKLYNYPYSTRDGTVGYLNGLASRYADDVQTHYQDVLHQLDILRQRVWLQMAAQQQQLQHEQRPLSPPSPAAAAAVCMPPPQQQQPDITQSVQPIYTPGKYLPSSCLSDDDEDEIYGFGYGVLDTRSRPQSRQGSAAARQPYGTDSPTYGFTARYPGDRNMRYLPETATERKAKKRGKLRKLFHTLKLSKHGNAPATNKRKRVRSSRDSAAPVLMPGSNQFVTSTPHRTAGDEAQMFQAMERDRMQEQIWLHESSGEALMLRSLDSDVGNEDISPSGPVPASFRTRPAGAGGDVWWSAGGAVASGPWLDEPGLSGVGLMAAGTPDSEPDDRRLPPPSVCPSVFSPSDSSLRDRLVMSRPPSVPPASTCGPGAFSVQRYYQNVGYTLAPAAGGDLLPAALPPVSAADRVALLAGHQLHPTANQQQMIISMADLTLRQQQHHQHYRSSAANS